MFFKIAKYFLFFSMILFLFSCSFTKPKIKETFESRYSSLERSVVALRSVFKIIPGVDDKTPKLDKITRSTGFVIENHNGITYILGAGHSCYLSIRDGSKMMRRKLKYDEVINYKVLTELLFQNKEKKLGYIMKIDKLNDLCLIITPYTNITPVSISNEKLKRGSPVFILGFPDGVGHGDVNVLPLLSGNFAGHDKVGQLVLTVPVYKGSSGSPIFNDKGDLVGLLSAVNIRFPTISYGVSIYQIQRFVEKIKEDIGPDKLIKSLMSTTSTGTISLTH